MERQKMYWTFLFLHLWEKVIKGDMNNFKGIQCLDMIVTVIYLHTLMACL